MDTKRLTVLIFSIFAVLLLAAPALADHGKEGGDRGDKHALPSDLERFRPVSGTVKSVEENYLVIKPGMPGAPFGFGKKHHSKSGKWDHRDGDGPEGWPEALTIEFTDMTEFIKSSGKKVKKNPFDKGDRIFVLGRDSDRRLRARHVADAEFVMKMLKKMHDGEWDWDRKGHGENHKRHMSKDRQHRDKHGKHHGDKHHDWDRHHKECKYHSDHDRGKHHKGGHYGHGDHQKGRHHKDGHHGNSGKKYERGHSRHHGHRHHDRGKDGWWSSSERKRMSSWMMDGKGHLTPIYGEVTSKTRKQMKLDVRMPPMHRDESKSGERSGEREYRVMQDSLTLELDNRTTFIPGQGMHLMTNPFDTGDEVLVFGLRQKGKNHAVKIFGADYLSNKFRDRSMSKQERSKSGRHDIFSEKYSSKHRRSKKHGGWKHHKDSYDCDDHHHHHSHGHHGDYDDYHKSCKHKKDYDREHRDKR